MGLVTNPKNCDPSVKKAIQQLASKLGMDSIPIFTGLTLSGKVTAGSFASPVNVTNTRQYGFELHYSGNNYDVTGIRSRAQLVTTDTTATAQGAVLQAANNDNINVGCLNGALIEALGKATTNAATITMMRGALIGAEWSAKDTVTDLRVLHVRTHTRDAAIEGYISGTGYGIYIENEAVGGNGQALNAGIYFKGTNLSAGNKAFTYGIDFRGATYTNNEIKFTEGAHVGSKDLRFTPKTTQPLVTFIFDDGVVQTYTVMKPVFDSQGEIACSAVVTDLMGAGGYLSTAQLVELEGNGWEILSHSKSHTDLTTLTEAQIETELLDSKDILKALGLTIENFVYPGNANNEIVRRLTRKYYRSARKGAGINPIILIPYELNSNNADDHTLLATYKTYVDTAESENKWVMFHLHVTDSDDATAIGELIDYIQAKNISIVTVNQGLDLVGNMLDVGDNFAVGEIGVRINYLDGPLLIRGTGQVTIAQTSATYPFLINSEDGFGQIKVYQEAGHAWFKTTDGSFNFQTDEGDNTSSYIAVSGKGTGRGYLQVFDEDDAERVEFRCGSGSGFLSVQGTNPASLELQTEADVEIAMFSSSASGETQELQIFGYRGGDASRSLQIGVGVDAADTASFDGVSNYIFDGTIKTNGFTTNLVTKTANYTATVEDYTIICNATGGAFTITLPAATSHTGRLYYIKKIDLSPNTITVDGNSSETIDDSTTAVLTAQYESITIQSDGSEWWII